MGFKKIKVERISHMIVEQIRREIIMGKYNTGDYLPTELEFMEKFDVSRASVREALQLLEGFGVIDRKKREGTIVRNVTIEDLVGIYTPKLEEENLVDLYETRLAIETVVVELVIERATYDEIIELEKTLEWMLMDPQRAAEDDIVFHIMLAQLSGNQVMISLIQTLKKTMDKIEKISISPERVTEIAEEHRQIIHAIKERDVERAQHLLVEHLERGRERVVKNKKSLKKIR